MINNNKKSKIDLTKNTKSSVQKMIKKLEKTGNKNINRGKENWIFFHPVKNPVDFHCPNVTDT